MAEMGKRTSALRGFRERRISMGKSIRDLEAATGIHRARLSPIERGMQPSLAEHQAIEAALDAWETGPNETTGDAQ